MGKKTKKKLKQLLGELNKPSVAVESSSLVNDMAHNCDNQYSIYVMKNGFNVVCRNNKRDHLGHISEHKVSIVYVATLAEIPSVLAANGAARMMGV